MALKLRRLVGTFTNAILPQITSAVSFKRVLGDTRQCVIQEESVTRRWLGRPDRAASRSRRTRAPDACQVRGYPSDVNAVVISSRMTGSSIVGGTRYSTPSAIFFIVPRRILPERVLGNRWTTVAVLKQAT